MVARWGGSHSVGPTTKNSAEGGNYGERLCWSWSHRWTRGTETKAISSYAVVCNGKLSQAIFVLTCHLVLILNEKFSIRNLWITFTDQRCSEPFGFISCKARVEWRLPSQTWRLICIIMRDSLIFWLRSAEGRRERGGGAEIWNLSGEQYRCTPTCQAPFMLWSETLIICQTAMRGWGALQSSLAAWNIMLSPCRSRSCSRGSSSSTESESVSPTFDTLTPHYYPARKPYR